MYWGDTSLATSGVEANVGKGDPRAVVLEGKLYSDIAEPPHSVVRECARDGALPKSHLPHNMHTLTSFFMTLTSKRDHGRSRPFVYSFCITVKPETSTTTWYPVADNAMTSSKIFNTCTRVPSLPS
jgi:hypothetical protein